MQYTVKEHALWSMREDPLLTTGFTTTARLTPSRWPREYETEQTRRRKLSDGSPVVSCAFVGGKLHATRGAEDLVVRRGWGFGVVWGGMSRTPGHI